MGPRCSSAETQVCHRSYIIAARYNGFLVSFFLKIFHKNDFQVTSDIYVCTCFFLIDYVEGFLYLCQRMSFIFFSSPDPKGHVSYCHHLAVVVRRKLFQKSSPLKVLDQWKPSLVWIITRVFSFKIVSGDAVHQPTWPLLLKIEHMVKLQVLGNNSKIVNNIKNLTWGENVQHIKIYLPCNFEVNLITHLGVIALFSSNL